ncbi:MAG TPA: peptidylprolyl isomerase [Acidimicrobiia bacterium]|nr:peptidylprolyl isomerase [Acidimicrobiia bacterium]
MKKSILRLAALGLVLAACGGSGAIVATVNGAEVSVADVEELYAGTPGAVPATQFAENLRNAIVELVVIQEAEREFGIVFGPEEIEARRAELESQIVAQSGGASYEEFLEQNGFTEERIYRIAHQQLVAEAVGAALVARDGAITEEALQARYDAALFDLTQACVSHILVETEEEAQAAKDRIDDGESFAEVAMDVGTDGTAPNGGELGCDSLSRYVPEFALAAFEAPLGEVTRPVRSQFGYHLILVTERTSESYEAVVDDLRVGLEAEREGRLVQDWLLEAVTAADVTVDADYGTWVVNPFPTVQPPA